MIIITIIMIIITIIIKIIIRIIIIPILIKNNNKMKRKKNSSIDNLHSDSQSGAVYTATVYTLRRAGVEIVGSGTTTLLPLRDASRKSTMAATSEFDMLDLEYSRRWRMTRTKESETSPGKKSRSCKCMNRNGTALLSHMI
jgi:hypothetical protein